MRADDNTRRKEYQEVDVLDEAGHAFFLVVWNDDVNTFDWVIQSLIEICGHTEEQAEQCALLIHYTGKYAVKEDSFEKLRPQKEALLDRGIDATIEEQVDA
jgi:ATP-dependent Clp protease adaptor protein ClpS